MPTFNPPFFDRSRLFLWWPVGMGTGIAFYFTLCSEPSLTLALVSVFISLGAVLCCWNRHNLRLIALAFLSLSIGFGVAKVRTACLGTPFLVYKAADITVQGRLLTVEEQPHRRRLILDQLTFSFPLPPLHKIRLTYPLSKPFCFKAGDRLSVTADLLPLSAPVSIKGYNFRRQAYFQGIGATGRIKGLPDLISKPPSPWGIDLARDWLTAQVRRRLPPQTREIAAALITGERAGIRPEIRQAFTDAGLAHILAISGLHLSLVAGLIFLLFRRTVVLVPAIAVKYPVKKIAAVLVATGALAYLAISGFGIPGQRAFIMICILMAGILLDRNPLSMRLVAIAATVILFFRPESLLSASFQLSFAAVTALVAAYEGGWPSLRDWSHQGHYCRRLISYGIGLLATTVIASLATMPYTIAIFNRFTLQTLAGNFMAIPLTSFLIMPSALLSVFSLAFGGWEFAFNLLSFGLDGLIHISQAVSSWPGAAFAIATPSPLFVGLVTAGGLWICLWTGQCRWWGILAVVPGIGALYLTHPPDIYVAGDGSVIAYKDQQTLYVSDLKRGCFYTDQWMKESGLKQKKLWVSNEAMVGPVFLMHLVPALTSRRYTRFRPASYYYPPPVLKDICYKPFVITTSYIWRNCKKAGHIPDTLIDRFTLKNEGTQLIWVNKNNVIIRSVNKSLGHRSWNQG